MAVDVVGAAEHRSRAVAGGVVAGVPIEEITVWVATDLDPVVPGGGAVELPLQPAANSTPSAVAATITEPGHLDLTTRL